MINIAYSSLCCKYTDDIFKLALKNPYKSIEWDLNFIPPTLKENQFKSISEIIKRNNIHVRYHLPYSFVEIAHISDEFRVYSMTVIRQYLKFISSLNGQYAIIHIGCSNNSHEINALQSLSLVAAYANELNIKICIENLIYGLSTNMNFLKKCLDIPNVYLCLDTGHAEYLYRRGHGKIVDGIASFGNKIVHAHVYDYEDDNMNHISFLPESIKNNIWLPILSNTMCNWYTMELNSLKEQYIQNKLISRWIYSKKLNRPHNLNRNVQL